MLFFYSNVLFYSFHTVDSSIVVIIIIIKQQLCVGTFCAKIGFGHFRPKLFSDPVNC